LAHQKAHHGRRGGGQQQSAKRELHGITSRQNTSSNTGTFGPDITALRNGSTAESSCGPKTVEFDAPRAHAEVPAGERLTEFLPVV
jgi:hypothetical protein